MMNSDGNVRRIILSAAVGACLIVSSVTCAATLHTISFEEDRESFEWKFRWDGNLPSAREVLIARLPNGGLPEFWGGFQRDLGPRFELDDFVEQPENNLFDNMNWTAQHEEGPHLFQDFDPGDPFGTIIGEFPDRLKITELMLGTDQQLSRSGTLNHKPHIDFYSLLYTRVSLAGPIDFRMRGFHSADAPPVLALLAIAGVAFLFTGRRQKHLRSAGSRS